MNIITALVCFLATQDEAEATDRDIRSLSLDIRISKLTGEAFDGSDWNDFFGTGYGLGLEYSYLWRTSDALAVGMYSGFSYDVFPGHLERFEDSGTTVTLFLDDLRLAKVIAGGKIREIFNNAYLEQYMGLGATFYQSLDGDISVNGTPTGDVNVMDGSVEFLFEIGLSGGVALGKRVDLSIGVEYEVSGDPEPSDEFGDINLKGAHSLMFTFGLELRL